MRIALKLSDGDLVDFHSRDMNIAVELTVEEMAKVRDFDPCKSGTIYPRGSTKGFINEVEKKFNSK